MSGDATVGNIGDHGTVNLVMPRREVAWPVVVGSAPPLASAFQTRTSVLERIDGQGGTLGQVLCGDGGVGKSQIAAGVFDSSGADLRLWVPAHSRTAVLSAYAQAAVRLDLANHEKDEEVAAGLLMSFLQTTERDWMVVLDDVVDPAEMTALWPTGVRGRLLVTTRRREAAMSGGGRSVLDVGAYSPEEARTYLRQRLTGNLGYLPADALDEADALVEDLGRLPLGLAQAAAVIIDQGLSCHQYRGWFADRSRRVEELFPSDANADGYASTVATTWVLAVEAADRIDPRELATPMARMVSLLDAAGIPEAVLTSKAVRDVLADQAGRDDVTYEQARKALRALHRLSLISHDPDQRNPRAVSMHALTARAVHNSVAAEHLGPLARAAANGLLGVWPDVENHPVLSEALRANTKALHTAAPDVLWDDTEGGSGAHAVLFRAGKSLDEVSLVGAAIEYWTQFLAQAARRLGPHHRQTLTARNNLGGAYQSAGNLARAIQLYEQTVDDFERVLGPDHPDTLTSRNNLAGAYELAGRLDRAMPLYEQTLAERERVLGPDHPHTLTSRNNLAGAYESAAELDRAIPLYEQTLADSERVLGSDHPQTLTSRNNLAGAYRSAGKLDRAMPLYEQTLADSERVLGADHPHTLSSRNNLAGAYRSVGDLGRAIPLYEQTLAERERVLGSDHPQTLTSRNNLAGAYESVGDLGRAIPLFLQTLAERERLLGSNHPKTLASRNNLAVAYESAGDVVMAVALYEQTLADSERVLGPNHPQTLTSRKNLAGVRGDLGDI